MNRITNCPTCGSKVEQSNNKGTNYFITLGNGLNPEYYEDIINILVRLVKCLETTDITKEEAEVLGLNKANELLLKARI